MTVGLPRRERIRIKRFGVLLQCLKIAHIREERMSDLPNFAAWERQTLDRFALDAYLRLQAQQEALEQLRQDLRDAMKLLRGSAL